MMPKVRSNIILRTAALFLSLCIAGYLFLHEMYMYVLLTGPLIIYQLFLLYRTQLMLHKEVEQFAESLYYRDFSRHYNSDSKSELQRLYRNFNQISKLFQQVSREKETQYQYLQKILELVNTGIISYETETGEVIWANESLKQMVGMPYIRTIGSFEKRDPSLHSNVMNLRPGESRIVSIVINGLNTKVLLSATAFQTNGKKYNLIAFQNVNEALDETESRAWQKLLNVLTHEIMNSIAPISSLADTIKGRIETLDKGLDTDNALGDLELGVSTIKRRSEGLLKFAETYRNLNKVSKPNLQKIYVRDLFENLSSLMQPTLAQKNIELEIILKDPNLAIDADGTLVEQVFINLLVNAIEAVKSAASPQVSLSGETAGDKVLLKVTDNGAGIDSEMIDKIFIPFFSTRKNGSGIGLTLCKQIMSLHGGGIQVFSRKGQGTSFVLSFG